MYCRYLHYNLSELKEHAPQINWDRYFGGIKAGEYKKSHTYSENTYIFVIEDIQDAHTHTHTHTHRLIKERVMCLYVYV